MENEKKDSALVRSSAAEYLTFVASTGEDKDSIEMRYEDENIWLTQKMMATLYDVGLPTINEHIKKIYADHEQDEAATIRKFRIVQNEGGRQVTRSVNHYNLQMIIAVGFKVNNQRAVRFRVWANQIVEQYTIKGWAMDEERLKNGGPFPMFTSCCPAWVKYLENENPKYLKNISTCKSPMEMVGAIFRDKYAAKDAVDGRTTYHIAIMPCTAKKMEAARPEFIHDGRPDVDLVLTTHEVIDMMQETGIQLGELELESPDLPFGLGSGAAVIYGTSGGVAEAVVRHCLPDKSKNALREISILGLRGDAPIKEASVTIGDTELKLAVVNGLANAKKLLKEIDEGKKFYHLIEVMTCQGGCVGGAGQPYGLKKSKEKRGDGLHLSDNAAMFKRAERNPVVAQMMAEYGEERCHELLHVTYTNK